MGQPFLGAVIIVRDAEKTIRNLLKSIAPIDLSSESLPLDEYVIVDTGSIDGTRAIIEEHFWLDDYDKPEHDSWPSGPGEIREYKRFNARIVLAKFDWIDDFSAARNYAFSLGTAKWRMWLDADDILSVEGGGSSNNLRANLEQTERDHPEVNVVLMRYDYAPPTYVQDKWRILRWADGWRWEGAIHEEIVAHPAHSRQISKWDEKIKIVHQEGRDVQRSIRRNVEMCSRIYARASDQHNVVLTARMAYYLGQYAVLLNDLKLVERYFLEAGENLGFTNLACYAYCDLAYEYVRKDRPHDAIKIAGSAIAKCPSLPDGYAALGVALEAAKDYQQAANVFAQLYRMPDPPIQSNRDTFRHAGLVPISAMSAFLKTGRVSEASQAMGRINGEIARLEELYVQYSGAKAELLKAVGLQRLRDLVNYYIWNNEPLKALDLLDQAPSNIEALPAISEMRSAIWAKMPQCKSWKDYCVTYAAETNEVFDRDEKLAELITKQGRAQYLKRWMANLPKEGDPIDLYIIGIHGGFIEEEAMKTNPRIRITASDVNPNSNYAIKRLQSRFPDRVFAHQVVRDHYDWIPASRANTFDGVVCFEVIEHVPEPEKMVDGFTRLLKPNGHLFLSTPIAEYWVEPDATKTHHWHQHLTAWRPHLLWDLLYSFGFRGSMWATDQRVLHLCHMQLSAARDVKADEIVIWCPHPAVPFDPASLRGGHLGGSEEAVVHLSRALARKGVRMTVYGTPRDLAEMKIHVDQNVLWRDNVEFDPARLSGKTVFVWRSPRDAAWLKKTNPKLRVLNWCHDSSYEQIRS